MLRYCQAMAYTAAQQLDLVEEAIAAILAGTVSEYSDGRNRFVKHSLTDLYKIRAELKSETALDDTPGYKVVEL